MTQDLREKALALYTPPFKYFRGYIYDSQNSMVADKRNFNEPALDLRIKQPATDVAKPGEPKDGQ